MSYRTYVNGKQIFGNNECYPEWIDFIKKQGIEVSEDGNYDGNITDVMGAIETIEAIILRLAKDRVEKIINVDIAKTYIKNNAMSNDDKDTGLIIHAQKYNSLFDFSHVYDQILKDMESNYKMSLTDIMLMIFDNSYVFMSCSFLQACIHDIEKAERPSIDGEEKWDRLTYWRMKDGRSIHVYAG